MSQDQDQSRPRPPLPPQPSRLITFTHHLTFFINLHRQLSSTIIIDILLYQSSSKIFFINYLRHSSSSTLIHIHMARKPFKIVKRRIRSSRCPRMGPLEQEKDPLGSRHTSTFEPFETLSQVEVKGVFVAAKGSGSYDHRFLSQSPTASSVIRVFISRLGSLGDHCTCDTKYE